MGSGPGAYLTARKPALRQLTVEGAAGPPMRRAAPHWRRRRGREACCGVDGRRSVSRMAEGTAPARTVAWLAERGLKAGWSPRRAWRPVGNLIFREHVRLAPVETLLPVLAETDQATHPDSQASHYRRRHVRYRRAQSDGRPPGLTPSKPGLRHDPAHRQVRRRDRRARRRERTHPAWRSALASPVVAWAVAGG